MKKMIYLLSPTAHEGSIHLPMIGFKVSDIRVNISNYDLLMFTSKQAVVSVEKINENWKNIPCLAIGSATVKQIESLGGTVAYQPLSFYGEALSQDISMYFKEKRILYLRPKEISFDSKGFLEKEGIFIDEKIIYETHCIRYLKKEKPVKNAIIIFTSPSTIRCFLKSFVWDESYRAIVIGEATKKYLPSQANYVVADKATIAACIEKAKV